VQILNRLTPDRRASLLCEIPSAFRWPLKLMATIVVAELRNKVVPPKVPRVPPVPLVTRGTFKSSRTGCLGKGWLTLAACQVLNQGIGKSRLGSLC
jgi:hypothetical protein